MILLSLMNIYMMSSEIKGDRGNDKLVLNLLFICFIDKIIRGY